MYYRNLQEEWMDIYCANGTCDPGDFSTILSKMKMKFVMEATLEYDKRFNMMPDDQK